MSWDDMRRTLGEESARLEVIRQLRMFADSLETRRWPYMLSCKLAPGAKLEEEIITSLEITLSHPWPG